MARKRKVPLAREISESVNIYAWVICLVDNCTYNIIQLVTYKMELDKSQKITDLTLLLVKKLAGENQPESHVNRNILLLILLQRKSHLILLIRIVNFFNANYGQYSHNRDHNGRFSCIRNDQKEM